jgi:hypothetical protein
MTVDNGSIDSTKTTEILATKDTVVGGGDNLGEFRLPGKDTATAANTKPNTGEGILGAAASGAALGMTSNIVGTAMKAGAEHALMRNYIANPGMFTDFGGRVHQAINNGLDPVKNPFALLSDATRDNLGLNARLGLMKADVAIQDGLLSTTRSSWVPESSMLKLAGKGAIAGVADWGVDRGLEWATGSQTLRPNVLESSLVTAAAMSPLEGRYKVGAIALAVGVGKLSNIVGLT